ncbi:MAG: FHA domain-containing protein [Myxococcales bacterium]|nr:FHA domain-containing protein [Myxococcales bacterium]
MIESVEVVIKQPGQADRVIRLQEGATRLGRAEDNEVVLSDVGVSRRHAQVYVSRGEVTVEDLGSGNGTYFNGYRVQSQPVHDGDEIVIDPFVLQFRIRGMDRAPAAQPSRGGGGAPAQLEVVVGTGMAGSAYPITSRGLSIGRSEDRDVVIPDPAASRHHCQITPQGSDYTLRDMGSANGIFVNAVRVRECQLADGDLLRIGNTEMRFVRNDVARSQSAPVPRSNMGRSGWADPAPSYPGPSRGAPSMGGASMSRAPVSRAPVGHTGRAATMVPGQQQGSGPGRLLAIAFAGILAFLGLIAVIVVGGVALYMWASPTSLAEFKAQPPRWRLDLPDGLPSAPVDVLFNEGHAKMKDRDHRAALQDFYRILLAQPGRQDVGKFAFAAGEAMVMDALAKDFDRRLKERKAQDGERDKLLRVAVSRRSNYNSKQKAQLTLRRKYSTDPLVIEQATKGSWTGFPTEQLVALGESAEEATALISAGNYTEAAPLLEEVLEGAKNPSTRTQVLANLKLTQQELARASAEQWTKAVVLEAGEERGEAKEHFKEIASKYPSLPSARAHLERY